MQCAKCGNDLTEGAAFCTVCGAAVPPAAPANESEPPPVTVLIEPGAGVWTPAPDVAATSEENASAAAPAYAPPFAAAPPTPAAQPAFTTAYAGFWRRFAAYWIDWFLFFSLELFIAFVRGIPLGARQTMEPAEVAKGILVSLFLGWLYSAILESSPWQATVGKRAMDIYVTDLHGRRINFGKATGRFFGKLVSAMIIGIGFLMIGFTARKQGLHDMLAGCLVVRRTE